MDGSYWRLLNNDHLMALRRRTQGAVHPIRPNALAGKDAQLRRRHGPPSQAPKTPFYRFNSSPEVIRLVVLMYVRFPLSLRNVEDLLFERGIDISYETVRYWWNRFGPMFAARVFG